MLYELSQPSFNRASPSVQKGLVCPSLAVRNTFRKLPFHLARERSLQQLMSLVDPRIPIDVALDAARCVCGGGGGTWQLAAC